MAVSNLCIYQFNFKTMSEDKLEVQEVDVLDQIRKADKLIKQQLLLKKLKDIKKMARQILELKEQSVMILEEIGIEAGDVKRVIDFINESSDVKLTEEDRNDLRRSIKDSVKSKKNEIHNELEKHIEKNPFIGYSTTTSSLGSQAQTIGGLTYTTGNNTLYSFSSPTSQLNAINLVDGTKTLDIKL